MTDREPDYTECTLEELYDVMRTIDAKAHPDRARTVELLIRDREAVAERAAQRSSSEEPQRVTMADEDGNIAAVKPGRGMSFGRGIAEILSSLVFVAIVFFGFIDLDNPDMRYFAAFAIFVSVAGVITGSFHLYNAFAERRITEHDIVTPDKEPDPFGRFIGKE